MIYQRPTWTGRRANTRAAVGYSAAEPCKRNSVKPSWHVACFYKPEWADRGFSVNEINLISKIRGLWRLNYVFKASTASKLVLFNLHLIERAVLPLSHVTSRFHLWPKGGLLTNLELSESPSSFRVSPVVRSGQMNSALFVRSRQRWRCESTTKTLMEDARAPKLSRCEQFWRLHRQRTYGQAPCRSPFRHILKFHFPALVWVAFLGNLSHMQRCSWSLYNTGAFVSVGAGLSAKLIRRTQLPAAAELLRCSSTV